MIDWISAYEGASILVIAILFFFLLKVMFESWLEDKIKEIADERIKFRELFKR